LNAPNKFRFVIMGKMNLMKGKLLLVYGNSDLQPIIYKLSKDGYEILDTVLNSIVDDIRKYEPVAVIINMEVFEIRLLELCKALRSQQKFNKTAIVFLSCFIQEEVELKCLETGADYYITKPVSPALLLSKINAIHRRFWNGTETTSAMGDIIVDREKYLVLHNKMPINLPRKEFELLALLVSKTGKVFLRNEILNLVWNNQVDIRTVDVHVCKLRQKFGIHSIKTIKGIGYKIPV
jgi:two-component system, OmpR family, alkaline phosphatase synthesis response regulator PhoP